MGASCATVTPGMNEACCATKAAENTADAWCDENYPLEVSACHAPCLHGAHQTAIRPSPPPIIPWRSRPAAASHTARAPTITATSCVLSIPGSLPNVQDDVIVGATCATVTPRDRQGCCENKDADNVADAWCAKNWPVVQVPARLPAKLHPLQQQPRPGALWGSAQGLASLVAAALRLAALLSLGCAASPMLPVLNVPAACHMR